MKKIMAMLICALLPVGTVVAQTSKTYTGLVVDKNGNPVVGAEVMAPGGGISTITDSDGSFSIEVPFMLKKLTASYAGMREKSLKLGKSSNLIFKMNALKKRTGFISLVGNIGFVLDKYENFWENSYSGNENDVSVGGGVMAGQIGQLSSWGWYVKGMGYYGIDYCLGYGSLTAGAIRKLGTNAHLYFGGGASYLYTSFGFSLDLGTIFTVGNHVNIIAGLNYAHAAEGDDYSRERFDPINLNIGVGYTF